MKIIFFGSPAYSIPIIDQIKTLDYDLLGVVTQNDQKIRRRKILKTAVYSYAEKKGFKIFSPSESLNDDFINEIRKLNPDLIIIFAYGKILPNKLISIPKHGCLNIHASILPKWRGAAPIQRALLSGEKKTGITFFKINEELDKGNIVSTHEIQISDKDDSLTLQIKLSKLAVENLKGAIESIVNGSGFLKQNESESSYAKKISKKESIIDWNDAAVNIISKVRAFVGWPVAEGLILGTQIRIWSALLSDGSTSKTPGEVVSFDKNGLKISTGKGIINIQKLQFAGKNVVTARDLFNSNDSFSKLIRKTSGQQNR